MEWWLPGTGVGRELGSSGRQFQFCKMKSSGDWLHNDINLLIFLYYWYFTVPINSKIDPCLLILTLLKLIPPLIIHRPSLNCSWPAGGCDGVFLPCAWMTLSIILGSLTGQLQSLDVSSQKGPFEKVISWLLPEKISFHWYLLWRASEH